MKWKYLGGHDIYAAVALKKQALLNLVKGQKIGRHFQSDLCFLDALS